MINANVGAFLHVIKVGEGTADPDGYRRIYGGELVTDLSDHPHIAKKSPYGWTTAAGAYQAMAASPTPDGGHTKVDTWGDFQRACGPTDFSPESQDRFAVWCITRRKALQDVIDGRIIDAIRKCNKEWASLPESPYGQPTRNMAQALSTYRAAGGTVDGPAAEPVSAPVETTGSGEITPVYPTLTDVVPEQAPAPVEERTPEDARMPFPLLIPIASMIAQNIPAIMQAFGAKPEKQEIAEKLLDTATQAVQAVAGAPAAMTPYDVAMAVQDNPNVRAELQRRMLNEQNDWAALIKGDNEERAKAREFSMAMADKPNALKTPAFIIAMVLIMSVMGMCWYVLVKTDDFSSPASTQIIQLASMLILLAAGFFLGSSNSSQLKDQLKPRV